MACVFVLRINVIKPSSMMYTICRFHHYGGMVVAVPAHLAHGVGASACDAAHPSIRLKSGLKPWQRKINASGGWQWLLRASFSSMINQRWMCNSFSQALPSSISARYLLF
jgi:hypothetical protein